MPLEVYHEAIIDSTHSGHVFGKALIGRLGWRQTVMGCVGGHVSPTPPDDSFSSGDAGGVGAGAGAGGTF